MLGHMIDPNTPEHYFKWTATKPKKPTVFSAQDCQFLDHINV